LLVAEGTRAVPRPDPPSEPCGRWENGAHDLIDQALPARRLVWFDRSRGRSTERTVRFSRRSLAAGGPVNGLASPYSVLGARLERKVPVLARAASGFLTPPAGADWWGRPDGQFGMVAGGLPVRNRDGQGAEMYASLPNAFSYSVGMGVP